MIRHDRYRLTRSPAFALRGSQEVRQDLTLRRAHAPAAGAVFGFLSPRRARARAVVKLLADDGEPVAHVKPDRRTGFFLLDSLPAGCYRLAAVSPGFQTFLGRPFRLPRGAVLRRDIHLRAEPCAERGALGGRVLTAELRPLADARLALMDAHDRHTAHTTTTIADGEYLFCGVPPGEYLLIAWKPDFIPTECRLTLRGRKRAERDIVLTPRL